MWRGTLSFAACHEAQRKPARRPNHHFIMDRSPESRAIFQSNRFRVPLSG